MKATAWAPANIAFIKYWGKADEKLRLPLNTSISMNIDGAYTLTTVDFSSSYDKDSVVLVDGNFSSDESNRVIHALDRIRRKTKTNHFARVVTKNTFPKGAGAAASASGFAALTVAAFGATGEQPSEKELTIFARMGSGSACRSIPDGFTLWEQGDASDNSFAYSLHPHTYWDLRDVLVIVDSSMKKVSTTKGMETVRTSPLLKKRLASMTDRITQCKNALAKKNFRMLGDLMEEECLDMHAVMQTQKPPLYYWNEATKKIMYAVQHWRKEGVPVYFTIDAGPNVHLICEAKDEGAVLEKVKTFPGVLRVIPNKPSRGAHLIERHVY